MLLAVVAALGSGLINAVSAVLQRRAALSAPSGSTVRLIRFLVRQPGWLLGALLAGVAFALQALALAEGQLSLVQPLLMSEILFLLMILLVRYNEPIGLREWLGALGISVGLGVLLAVASPHGGVVNKSGAGWLITGIITLVLTVFAITFTVSVKHRSLRAAVLGTAAGILFGVTAALTKLSLLDLQNGFGSFLASWPPYALLVTGVASIVLAQNVFRAGPLAASQPALMIGDPAAGVAIGVLLFHDQLRHTTAALTGISMATAVLITGIIMLAGSPVILGESSLSV